MNCLTCKVKISPSGRYEDSYEDEYGSVFGPDHGEDIRPVSGMVYWHRHYPDTQYVRRSALEYFFDETSRECEACGQNMPNHDWVALATGGVVVWCNIKPKGADADE